MSCRRALLLLAVGILPACDSNNPSTPDGGNGVTTTTTLATVPPAPTATPTATPTPTPSGNQNPAVDVRASVTSFLRYGRLQRGRAATFIPGDVIYLTCTPLDNKGDPTKNHGRIRDWEIFSNNGLVNGVDWFHTDVNTFNPDVHISENSHDGEIRARCEVDSVNGPLKSASVPMVVVRPQ
jgi:hypothetical protein